MAEAAAPHLTGPDQGEWFARLDAEQANLRRGGEHAARDPDATGQVLRFGVALRHYWISRSRHQDTAGLLLPVLERPEARADPGLFAAALVPAAMCAREAGLAAPRQLGERAVELARRLGDDFLLGFSLLFWLMTSKSHGPGPRRAAVHRGHRRYRTVR